MRRRNALEDKKEIEKFAKRNLSVRDRKAVYLTHLDIDHAGGLQEGKDVKDITCSEAEKEAAFKGGARYRKPSFLTIRKYQRIEKAGEKTFKTGRNLPETVPHARSLTFRIP
jgi:glyoxylase-like metal-dependent hydrolase (beta-lactamase superfamily II)